MKLKILLLGFGVFLLAFMSFVSASFDFQGYTKYINGTNMSKVNVSIEITQFQEMGPPISITTLSNLSDAEGYFNISVNDTYDNVSYNYRPVITKYNGTSGNGKYAEYTGQSLPDFPNMDFSMIGNSLTTFYLKEAVTLDLSVVGNVHNGDSITYLENLTLGGDYKTGLVIANESQFYSIIEGVKTYSYINDSDCLIILNSTRDLNSSFCNLNITNIIDLTRYSGGMGDNAYFLLNSTNIEKCYTPGNANLICNETSNNFLDVLGFSYDIVYGMNVVYNNKGNSSLFVSGTSSGTHWIGKFYTDLTYMDKENMPSGKPSGKMAWGSDGLYFAANNSGTYILYSCFVDGDLFEVKCGGDSDPINFTEGEVVKGISYNDFDKNLYYASGISNNITSLSMRTNIFSFFYQIKDTSLGYPVKESWNTASTNARFFIPADGNYSMMIYPNNGPGFPAKVDLTGFSGGNNISLGDKNATIESVGGGLYANLSNANMTTDFVWLPGYIKWNASIGQQNFTNLTVIAYLLEGGDMVYKGSTLPANMGQWQNPPINDVFNKTTGFYNMSLPASVLGANILLFAAATVNESGTLTHYGGFRNVTLIYEQTPDETNFTLYPLLGEESNISIGFGETDPNSQNILTKQTTFNLQNASGSEIEQAHVEVELNYPSSQFPGSDVHFSWMVEVSQGDNGAFEIPLLNYSLKKLQIFSSQFAPLKKQYSQSDLQENPVNISMHQFENKNPNGTAFDDSVIQMMMYIHKDDGSCTVPYPDESCSPEMGKNGTEFNPFSMVIGGGKLDFEIKQTTNNITVRYVDVNLLASGPPDATFDDNSNKTSSGSAVDEAWRFGSLGPDIYEYVLIGVPYDTSTIDESGDIKINITKFYGESFDTANWQQGINGTDELNGTDYEDYSSEEYAAYINGTAILCNSSDDNLSSGLCYKNTEDNILWFKIPHFSGIGPSIIGAAVVNNNEEPPSSGGGGGGSLITSFWTKTQIMTEDEFKEGKEVSLGVKNRARVRIGIVYHYVGIISMTATTATINVSSDPQQATLSIGDERRFDVTKDGYYDIYVKLESILDNQANITIKEMHEEVIEETEAEEQAKEQQAQEEKETETGSETLKQEKGSNLTWLWVLIVCVLLVLVVIGILVGIDKKRRRKQRVLMSY